MGTYNASVGASEGLSAEVVATHMGRLPVNSASLGLTGNYPQPTMSWCSLKHPTQCLDLKLSQMYRCGTALLTPAQIKSRHCCTQAYMGTVEMGG